MKIELSSDEIFYLQGAIESAIALTEDALKEVHLNYEQKDEEWALNQDIRTYKEIGKKLGMSFDE